MTPCANNRKMLSKVNLVVVVLIGAMCLTRAHKESQICTGQDNKSDQFLDNQDDILGKKLIDAQNAHFLQISENRTESANVTQLNDSLDEQLKSFSQARRLFENEKLDESPRGKGKMDQMLLSMLVAYKLKFLALIPTLIGSVLMLLASNALVGFFFALFAAAVSLKGR